MRGCLFLIALTGCEVLFPLSDPDGGAQLDVPIGDAPDGLPAKRIFVTSTTFTGDLGGLASADASCNERASAARLTGEYVAFLSDSERSANDRMSKQGQFLTTTGMPIANNYEDLTDNALAIAINNDEMGTFVEVDTCVWTGSAANGEIGAGEPNCNNWMSSAQANEGLAGSSETPDFGWAIGCFRISCAGPARLYCVEQ